MIARKEMPSVAIVILNYNNAPDTIECIESIYQNQYKNYQIVLVDNDSTDDSEEVLCNHFPEIKFIQTGKNNGYANGNNIGIKYAIETKFDYVCILNNDVIVDPDFLTKMIDYMEIHQEVGVTGPRICDYRNPSILESAGSIVNYSKGEVTRLYTNEDESTVINKLIPCDYVGGACMVFKTSMIEEVGFIPENYFLFYEENEWCATIKKKGYQIVCIGDAKVIHKGSASINKVSGLSEYFMYRNLVIFINRNASLKNRLLFYPYICLFAIKSGLTKKDGWRFMRYFYDGLTGRNKYQNKL